MGFFFHVIELPKAITITITFFLNMLSHVKFLVIGALTHLGLYKPPPEEEEDDSSDNSNNYIFIFDGSSPSLVPIPIHMVTASIKNRVPVVKYEEEENAEGKKVCCTICLDPIELNQEVRELCNCSHMFHRVCLDTWVDAGHVTCPLCRSMLLPPKAILSRCRENQACMAEEGDAPLVTI